MNIADMRTTHSRDAYTQLREVFGEKVFDDRDPLLDRLRRVRGEGALDPGVPARTSGADYLALADEVLSRIGREDARAQLSYTDASAWGSASSTATTRRRSRASWRSGSPSTTTSSTPAQAHTAEGALDALPGGAGRTWCCWTRSASPGDDTLLHGDPRGRARSEGDRLLGLRAADAGGRARRRGRRLPREGRRRRRRSRRHPRGRRPARRRYAGPGPSMFTTKRCCTTAPTDCSPARSRTSVKVSQREEPVLVAARAQTIAPLRERARRRRRGRVRRHARSATTRRGSSPLWRDFADAHAGPVRGIGEPIWPGRGGAELVECQLHESLLNLAFAAADFTLLCPYDAAALDERVLHEACCSHPLVDGAPSPHYRSRACWRRSRRCRRRPPAPACSASRSTRCPRCVSSCATRAATPDFVLAVDEVAANSIRHGGGRGIVRIWRERRDARLRGARPGHHRATRSRAGRARTSSSFGGRGLWIANAVCDLVQIRPGRHGRGSEARDQRPAGVNGTRST